MDSHKALPADIGPKEQSVVDMIRVATYVKDVDKAIKLVNDATAKGYQTTINIMAISREGGRFLDEAVQQLEAETKANAIYIVDSFGAMYSEEVHYLIERFSMYLKTKEIGVHFHNNQQLAFANTIEGIIKGANYVDGTLYGLGRAAGNCPLELLLGFLKNPKFSLLPILEVIGSHIIPLQQEIQWGYCIPHMLVGVLNRHPEASIRFMEGKNKYDYGDLYKKLTDEVQS
jgi:4-hydroxy 2-oxovalerate aldolase